MLQSVLQSLFSRGQLPVLNNSSATDSTTMYFHELTFPSSECTVKQWLKTSYC
jgi:hypothetical protein